MTIIAKTNARFDELQQLIARIANPGRGNQRKIADAGRQGFQDNISTEGAASGSPWPALKESTVAERRQRGFAGEHPILKRTGHYTRTFTNPSSPQHIEKISSGSDGMEIEVGSEVARWIHERGGDTRFGYVSQRSILGLGDRSEQRIASTIEFIVEQLERQVFK